MAGTTATLRAVITGSSASAEAAMARTAAASRAAADEMSSRFDDSTTKVGNLFQRLGQSGANMGIPLAGALTKMGDHFDEAKSHGDGLKQAMSDLGGVTLAAGAAGFAVIGAASLKAAGNFQQAMTQLVTGAGESQANIKLVSDGILSMAGATGTSADELAKGMYLVESAGYHGAAGLSVLKAAAEGAKVGNADLSTVADAVTSALNAYGLKGKDATAVTSQLVAVVASGKTHMSDLASSLSAVLPVAAAAHVNFAQVGGAIATMTSTGTSAQQATQNLANILRSLQNPSSVAVQEMEQLGLNSQQVALSLGRQGLTGTLGELTDAITSHMGPAGTVILNAFNQSQNAAKDLKVMLDAMPAPVQKLANEFMSGTMTMSQFRKAIPTNDQGMLAQFTAMYNKVHGFNSVLASGSPAAQTYTAALAKMVGGATGLNVALQLTGDRAATFHSNVEAVAAAAQHGSSNVQGWAAVQKDFNFQLEQAKAGAQSLEIRLGSALLPVIESLMHAIGDTVAWFEKHKAAAIALASVIGGVLASAVAVYLVNLGGRMVDATRTAISNLGRLVGVFGESSAAAEEEGAANDALAATLANLDRTLGLIATSAAEATSSIEPLVGIESDLADTSAVLAASNDAVAAAWDAAGAAADAASAGFDTLEAAEMDLVATSEAAGAASSLALGPIGIAIMAVATVGMLVATHWKQIWHVIEGIWHTLDSVAHAVFGAVLSFLKKWGVDILAVFLPVIGIPLLLATHWNQVISIAHSAFDAVVNFLKKWGTDILAVFLPVIGIPLLIAQHWNQLVGIAHSAFDAVVSFVASVPARIIGALASLGSDLLHVGETGIKMLIQGLMMLSPLYWVVHFHSEILAGLSAAGRWLLSIGKDIVMGLVHGIESMAMAPVHAIEHAAHGIIGAAKSVLSIFSPSQVFADMGKSTMEGLAKGINENKELAAAELRAVNLSKELAPDLQRIANAGREMGTTLAEAAKGMLSLSFAGAAASSGVKPVIDAIGQVAKALSDAGKAHFSAALTKDMSDLATVAKDLQPGPITAAINAILAGFKQLSSSSGIGPAIQADEAALRSFTATLGPVDAAATRLGNTVRTASGAFRTMATETAHIATSLRQSDSAGHVLETTIHGIETALLTMRTAVTTASTAMGAQLVAALRSDEVAARAIAPAFRLVATEVATGSAQVRASTADWRTLGTALTSVVTAVRQFAADFIRAAASVTTTDTALAHLGAAVASIVGGLAHIETAVADLQTVLLDFSKAWQVQWTNDETFLANTGDAIGTDLMQVRDTGLTPLRTALDAFRDNWRNDWDLMRVQVQNVWSQLQSIFSQVRSTGLQLVKSDTDTLKSSWVSDWSAIQSSTSGTWSQMGPLFSNLTGSQGLGGVDTALGKLNSDWSADWASMASAIQSAVGNAASVLFNTGVAIDQGLAQGIAAGQSGPVQAATNAANATVQAAKTAVGHSSPSKVFHDIGVNLMIGLAKGITDAQALPATALAQVARSLTATPFAGATVSPAAAAAATSTTAGAAGLPAAGAALPSGSFAETTLEVHVNLDGQQIAQKVSIPLRTLYLQQKRSTVTLGMG